MDDSFHSAFRTSPLGPVFLIRRARRSAEPAPITVKAVVRLYIIRRDHYKVIEAFRFVMAFVETRLNRTPLNAFPARAFE